VPALPALEREMTEEIRLVIPAEEEFRPIAHLVTGGLALRLDMTYDDLEDLQVAVDALLALRDDDAGVSLVLRPGDAVLAASVGPFTADAVRELDDEPGELGLRRVLETVCDTVEVDRRPDGAWVELTKLIVTAAGAA
jgi:hypothetical protein